MNQVKGQILWADDEIDHLKSHILFLEQRGYAVTPVTNAGDAIELVKKQRFDLILLDEMMPGMDGLEALNRIKELDPALPVVMVTKSEEENLMEDAIGGRIEDYLTKPVNPSQILSSCIRILEKRRISGDKLTRDYTKEFMEISNSLGSDMSPQDWIDIHIKLSEREVDLDAHPDLGLRQTLLDQRRECNQVYSRYIEDNYLTWLQGYDVPILSKDLVREKVIPHLREDKRVLFVVVDNLKLDQWLVLENLLYDYFTITRDYYFSILPTATPYSRNSLFAGLMPSQIEADYPDLWVHSEDDETSLNRHEHALLDHLLEREGIVLKPETKYIKVMDADEAKNAANQVDSFLSVPLSAMVFNFVDIMSHRRSDSELLKEIVPDEAAFRSLTRTWFEHSALIHILKAAARTDVTVVLTSDHGSIRTMRGATVHADRQTSTNVRYKYGRSIRTDSKQAFEIKDPQKYGLPARGLNTNYLIAKEDFYFVYPTNYHKYLALYRDSFQHGGISLEEMILPVITLVGK
ncbi:response regulator [candidate division KSB1 bacterium]|nr:response regulator [candidate division KSB1 bacterium]